MKWADAVFWAFIMCYVGTCQGWLPKAIAPVVHGPCVGILQ